MIRQSRAHLFMTHVLPWLLFALAAHALSPVRQAGSAVPIAAVGNAEAAGMVDVRTLAPELDLDLRYAGDRNFVGTRIDGYEAARCYLLKPAAEALARAEHALRAQGLALRIHDCYRPARAVRHFVRWATDLDDQHTRADYYPRLDKRELLGDYISPASGHSRGATVDLSLLRCEAGTCTALDMGTPFDFFDARANTDSPDITAEQRGNRQRLVAAMRAAGFRNYALEWWHYTLDPEPMPQRFFDFPIR